MSLPDLGNQKSNFNPSQNFKKPPKTDTKQLDNNGKDQY